MQQAYSVQQDKKSPNKGLSKKQVASLVKKQVKKIAQDAQKEEESDALISFIKAAMAEQQQQAATQVSASAAQQAQAQSKPSTLKSILKIAKNQQS